MVVVGQGAQDRREPIVGEIEPVDELGGTLPQRGQVGRGPRLDLVEPMVACGEQMGEPERRGPAEAEPEPVAVDGKVAIQQLADPHPLHLGQQEGEVVDPLDGERGRWGHSSCLSPFSSIGSDLPEPWVYRAIQQGHLVFTGRTAAGRNRRAGARGAGETLG